MNAVKNPKNSEEAAGRSAGAAACCLAGDRLPLREPVEEEHAAANHRDEPEREDRVEQRLDGGRESPTRPGRAGRGDRDHGDEPEHDERR